MSSTDAARRRSRTRRRSGYLALALVLGLIGAVYATFAPSRTAEAAAGSSTKDIRTGRAIYLIGCSTCHGLQAQGSGKAPSLIGVGSAAVNFQVGTGRMPLAAQDQEAVRKQPRYDAEEIRQLAAYVASLGAGPAIPADSLLNTSKGNAATGGELFRTNCAQCHNFNGSGGALTYGKYAPSLYPATKRQIYEAMQTGPENMPVFADSQLSPKDKLDIITFVKETHAQPDPGGFSLGRIGPVSEGLVCWLGLTAALVIVTLWIGARV